MNLDFITVVTADGAPAPESPMATVARNAGAILEVRNGWLVPATFADESDQRRALAETVGFGDASAMPKTELRTRTGSVLALEPGLSLGAATALSGAWWCPLTPTRALVLGARPPVGSATPVTSLDVTTQFCALRLSGPLSRRLLASFCALDLREAVAPVGALRPGSVARTPGLVIVEGPQRLLVLVGAALAEYLWTVVADAAERLGGRPVGSDLLSGEIVDLREEVAHA